MTTTDLERHLLALENYLLQPGRSAPLGGEASELLADDFVEFGKSGRVYDRATALAALREDRDRAPSATTRTIADFVVRLLAPNVALATYRVIDAGHGGVSESLRSSIWREDAGAWKVTFHQGTPRR